MLTNNLGQYRILYGFLQFDWRLIDDQNVGTPTDKSGC